MSNTTDSSINEEQANKFNKNSPNTNKTTRSGSDLPKQIDKQNLAFQHRFIIALRIIMAVGLMLILLGIYFHMYSDTIKSMGVTGMIISACCVAIGMIMSLPTKMYLTFVLVNHEHEVIQAKRLGKKPCKTGKK
jgi:hypothetical protein